MKHFVLIILLNLSFTASAVVPHTFSAGGRVDVSKINQNFNESNKADYDSGWIAVSTSTNNHKNLAHNLGVVPSKLTILLSDQETDSATRVIRPAPLNSYSDERHSPENVALSKNYILIEFYENDVLFVCDSHVNQCVSNDGNLISSFPLTTPLKSGYMKVLLWK